MLMMWVDVLFKPTRSLAIEGELKVGEEVADAMSLLVCSTCHDFVAHHTSGISSPG